MADDENKPIEYFDFSGGDPYYTPERMARIFEIINNSGYSRERYMRICAYKDKFIAARYLYDRFFDEPMGVAPPCTRCKHSFPRSDKCVFYQQGTEAAGIDDRLLDHRIPVEERCEYFEARQ